MGSLRRVMFGRMEFGLFAPRIRARWSHWRNDGFRIGPDRAIFPSTSRMGGSESTAGGSISATIDSWFARLMEAGAAYRPFMFW